MKKSIVFLLCLFFPLLAIPDANQNNFAFALKQFPGVPSGTCNVGQLAINKATGDLYTCPTSGTVWVKATSTGTSVSGSGLTAGNPVVGGGTTNVVTSQAYLDVTAVAGANPCVAANTALTSLVNGQRATMEGFSSTAALVNYGGTTWPDMACSVNPIPTTAQSTLVLPVGNLHAWARWAIPNRFTLIGQGWDRNPPQGFGATVISACKSTDGLALCNSTQFPAAPGGPIGCFGASRAGDCDRGGDNPIFDSRVSHITFDCKSIAGCYGWSAMNPEEGAGLNDAKFMNCYNGAQHCLVIAGGETPAASNISSISGTTVNGTGFTSDLLFNQVVFSSDVALSCGGASCTVASINSAGTVITLDAAYTGAACTNCSLTINNASAQNSSFYDLYFVHLNGTCTASGGAILMNTGSGSNEGPKFIREVTTVNSCPSAGSPTQITDMVRVSGCCTSLENFHQETFVNGISIGLDAPTVGLSVWNDWVGSSTGAGTEILISNLYATTNIGLYMLKTVAPNKPTNIVNDQVCSNVITTANESTLMMYVVGSTCKELVTTSHTISSSFSGANIIAGTNGLNTFQIFKADGTTSVLDVDTTNGRLGIQAGTPGAALDIAGKFQVASATGAITKLGNQAVVGPGAPALLYNTVSATTNAGANITSTQMFAGQTSVHTYRFSWYVDQVAAGTGACAATASTIVLNLIFTDTNAAGSNTLPMIGFGPNTNTAGITTTITIATSGSPLGAAGQVGASGTYTFDGKASQAIAYSTSGAVAPASCTLVPTYAVRPILEQVQ